MIPISVRLAPPVRRAQPAGGRRFDLLALGTALLRRLPPNLSHRLAIQALKRRLVPPPATGPDDPVLALGLWGLDFANPIGLAAGFDKDAEAVECLLGLGFGFIEAGTVTPRPQRSNPRPNLFRLDEDAGLINRLGFPSCGMDAFAENLARHRRRSGVVGANAGCNRASEDEAGDFAACIGTLAQLADYLVINVSSPNTPGLRALQAGDRLACVLHRALDARDAVTGGHRPPLLVKIAPDLDEPAMRSIARVVREFAVDGMIVSNTTVARPPSLRSRWAREAGGLSGPVLFGAARQAVATMYRLTDGRIPLIGCGGVASGADAFAMIRAGASLVQLYTALIYRGPRLVCGVKRDLAALLKAHGYRSPLEAVGADIR